MKAFFIQMASAWNVWLLAAVLAFAGIQTFRLDHAQTQAAVYQAHVASRDAERERTHAADQALARKTESDLDRIAQTTRKAADDAIRTSNLRIPANPAAGSTGAGLYREDGVFLAGEAAAAARIGAERDQCARLYTQARDTLITYSQEISQ